MNNGDMSEMDEQVLDQRRLERRQRRRRNQRIAYLILAGVMVVTTALVFITVYSLNKVFKFVKPNGGGDLVAAAEMSSEEVVIESPEAFGGDSAQTQEMSYDDLLDDSIDTIIEGMSLEDRVAGLFIVTPEQLTGVSTAVKAGSGTQEALMNYAVGGMAYFSKNIKNEEQITEMLDTTSSMSKYPVFTLVAEDGSKNGAISSNLGIDGITDVTDSDSARDNAKAIGSAMYKYGFNFNISPVLDSSSSDKEEKDFNKVKDIAVSFSSGLKDAGMTSCLNAFPAKADTSRGKTEVEKSVTDLESSEYKVFEEAVKNDSVNAIMVTGASYPNVDGDDTPACLSEKMVTDQLRNHLGFDGIILTDALNTSAITKFYSADEAAVAAIKAGADMIYLPEDFKKAYEGVKKAVEAGTISEDRINESLRRIYKIKYAGRVDMIMDKKDDAQ
ncbi:glycoside hydrolase family 3 N-terminal domain-containing protein [Butyrivibrio sp. M55]|uniref:glycoside hydrolase family 3 N-terminal domain-containing protein n=1 Tax=Butyrivibrio sp. M55 TaxID=1855323 RepID=UPI0008EA34E1|nr:glycoside hydrolase family 3 N-terminal domain-containing protein [Butyrivibrio sp. M55]SFU78841.1 beta-N-acetylhexosaminidase [Butyrivibrio sp. M55]